MKLQTDHINSEEFLAIVEKTFTNETIATLSVCSGELNRPNKPLRSIALGVYFLRLLWQALLSLKGQTMKTQLTR